MGDVVGMTMRRTEVTLGSHGLSGTCPWINTVGVYHRLRRLWGLQYCTLCLAEAPVLYRSWRLSFVVACRRHMIYLKDACPHCDAPLTIHRQRISAQLCHACSRPLTTNRDDFRGAPRKLFRTQSRYEDALNQGYGEIGAQMVCPTDLFDGVHMLLNLIKPSRLHESDDRRPRGMALEFVRTEDRAETLLQLEMLLAQWPNGFVAVARERHLTQRSFARWKQPKWLADAVSELPEGRPRSHASFRHRNALRSQLDVSRRHDAEWRTTRAELLWRAATQ